MLAHSPLQGCCCNGSLQHHWHRRQCQCVPHSQHEEGETGISPEILSVWTKGGRVIPTLDVLQYTCMGWKLPQGCVPEPWGADGQGPAVRTHPSTPAWSRAAEAAPGQPHTRHWALPWQQGQVKARLSACGWAWLSRIHGMAGQGCGELEPIPAGSGTVAPGQGETARVNLLSWRHPKALWTQSRKLIGALRTLAISLLLCHHNVPYKSVGLAIFIKTKKRVQMRGLALKVEIHIPQQSSDTFEEGEGTALGLLRTPENNPKSPKMTSTPASTPHPHSLYSRNTVWTLMSSCISSFLLQSHS